MERLQAVDDRRAHTTHQGGTDRLVAILGVVEEPAPFDYGYDRPPFRGLMESIDGQRGVLILQRRPEHQRDRPRGA